MSKLIEVKITFQASEEDAMFSLLEICTSPGAEVAEGDVLATVETEKTTLAVEAPESGTVKEIFLSVSPDAVKNYRRGTVFCTIEVL